MHSTVLWVYVCVCGFVYLACSSRAHVNLRQTWCLYALVMTIFSLSVSFFLSLSNQVWTKETFFLVDDSCNVSSLLYYSPLQLLITNVVVSFCFLLIDFASTLTDKLVKLKVFCSFSLSSYSLALSLTIFAPFVFSYFLGNSNSLRPSCSCFDFCLTKRNELTLNGKNKHFFTQLSLG